MYLNIKHVVQNFINKNITTTHKIKNISKTKHFYYSSILTKLLIPPPPSFPPLLPRINNISL